MKRSEMIKIIENDIVPYLTVPHKANDLAEWVLRSIENEGMLPPHYSKTIYGGDGKPSSSIFPLEWEPE